MRTFNLHRVPLGARILLGAGVCALSALLMWEYGFAIAAWLLVTVLGLH